jgi:hypothetical protein
LAKENIPAPVMIQAMIPAPSAVPLDWYAAFLAGRATSVVLAASAAREPAFLTIPA